MKHFIFLVTAFVMMSALPPPAQACDRCGHGGYHMYRAPAYRAPTACGSCGGRGCNVCQSSCCSSYSRKVYAMPQQTDKTFYKGDTNVDFGGGEGHLIYNPVQPNAGAYYGPDGNMYWWWILREQDKKIRKLKAENARLRAASPTS